MNTSPIACPVCEEGVLTPERFEHRLKHNQGWINVPNLERSRCGNCRAEPILMPQIKRNQVAIADARRRADGLLLGDQIRAIRENLKLSQAQAAEVFGGGANAFSKYERGEVIQGVSMDRLLRLISVQPALIGLLTSFARGGEALVADATLVTGITAAATGVLTSAMNTEVSVSGNLSLSNLQRENGHKGAFLHRKRSTSAVKPGKSVRVERVEIDPANNNYGLAA